MKKSFIKRIAICATLLFVSVAPGRSAQAASGDRKIFPGINCKYYGPQHSDVYLTASGLKANGIQNVQSYSSAEVVCPITRDIVSGDLLYADITVYGDVTCKLFLRKADGTSYTSITSNHSDTSGSPGTALQFLYGSTNSVTPYSRGSMAFHCVVEPGGRIYNYSITEE